MSWSTITVPVELEVEVDVEATHHKGFRQTLYEPEEPAGFEFEQRQIRGKGIRKEIIRQVDKYLDEEWQGICEENFDFEDGGCT